MEHNISHKKMKLKVNKTATVAIVIVIIFFAVGIFVTLRAKNALPGGTSAPVLSSQKDMESTITAVGKLMMLPSETPTLATVTDVKKLQGQIFFKNASDGDKVLMYGGAQEAILYDPNKNIIVNVAPLNVETTTSPTPVVITKSATTNVVLYYNNNSTGYDSTVEQALGQVSDLNVTKRVKAKKNYTKTQIVDVSNDHPDEVTTLANTLKATVGTLPTGEATPPANTDIVIIVGR